MIDGSEYLPGRCVLEASSCRFKAFSHNSSGGTGLRHYRVFYAEEMC
jgi:hypothetical protein